MNVYSRWFLIGLVLCIFYLLIVQVVAVWPFTIDDMYISLRYAKNWSAGHGLLWNIGEEPVEGYSNFSYVVLATLALRLGFDPLILLKAIGVASLALSTLSLYYLTRFFLNRYYAVVPALWLLCYRGELIWSVSGLETVFYQALICGALFFLLRGMGYSLRPHVDITNFSPDLELRANRFPFVFLMIAGFLLALAGLTRPEAPALMMLFWFLAFLDWPKERKSEYFKKLFFGCLFCFALFLPYFFWRWNYYGRIFPNPIYCKAFSGFWGVLDKGYLTLAFPFLFLSLVAMIKAHDKRHFFYFIPSCIYLVLLINGDPVSAFKNRLFLPVFALLLPLAFIGLCFLLDYLLPKRDEVHLAAAYMAAFFVAFFFLEPLTLGNYRFFTTNPQIGIQLRNEVLTWLNQNIPSNNQVVLGDSGQIPYYSSLKYIDSYCLNNKQMTKTLNKDMYEQMCEEVFIKKPQVLILTSLLLNKGYLFYAPTDACLRDKLKLDKAYQFRKLFTAKDEDSAYRYEIYTLSSLQLKPFL